MDNLIIIGIILVLIIVGVHSGVKHFKGEGGCCGGGSSMKPRKKKLKSVIAQKTVIVAGVKSGTVYTTSEQGEGYIMLLGTKWEKIKIGAALVMLKDMIKVLGGLQDAVQFLKEIKAGGLPIDDKLKKEKKDFLKVEMLVVIKEYQGQGHMRKLLEFAFEKADTYGVPCVLDTDAKNKLFGPTAGFQNVFYPNEKERIVA